MFSVLCNYRCLLIGMLLLPTFTFSQETQKDDSCNSKGFVNAGIIQAAKLYAGSKSNDVLYLKVRGFISTHQGNPAITPSGIQEKLDATNAIFEENNAGIQFILCGDIQYIDNYSLHVQSNYVPSVMFPHHERGYISLIFTAGMPAGVGAYASGDLIYAPHYASPNTLAHEFGHVLGLMHTHTGNGSELVDGSNCDISGDLLCDTPADPGLNAGNVDWVTCTYIGTATDANGDIYQPDVENIMSYSPCGRSTFSPGQIEVMQYVAWELKSYLKSTINPVLINDSQAVICDPDSPIILSGNSGQGIFTGAYVTNGILDVSGLSPGDEFQVNYFPDAQPDSSEYIDQSMIATGFLLDFAMDNSLITSVNQTFTAGANGRFTGFDFVLVNPQANNFITRLYSGSGDEAILLSQTNIDFEGGEGYQILHTPITSNIPVTSGEMYTISLHATQPVNMLISNGAQWPHVDYYPGNSDLPPGSPYYRDVAFRTWVYAPAPCTEHVWYGRIKQELNYEFSNIHATYCSTDHNEIIPIDNTPNFLPSNILINGNASQSFIPSELGVGFHDVSLEVISEGCVTTFPHPFHIVAPPEINIDTIPSYFCTSDEIYMFPETTTGTYRINGDSALWFDPAELGVGIHQLTYTVESSLDSLRGQIIHCCGGDANNATDYYQSMHAESFGQSFTPHYTGALDSVVMYISTTGQGYIYEVSVYEGNGTSGELLGSTELSIPPGSVYPNVTAGINLVLQAGTTYTIWLERIAGNEMTGPYILYYSDDYYAGGEAFLPSDIIADFYIDVYMTSPYLCSDTLTQEIEVQICLGLESGRGIEPEVFPNPYLDEFYIKVDREMDYSVYAIDGRIIKSGVIYKGINTIQNLPLTNGIHLLKLIDSESGMSTTKQMVSIRP